MDLLWTQLRKWALFVGLALVSPVSMAQVTDIPVTIDVSTSNSFRVNRDLIERSTYQFSITYYENGVLKDLSTIDAGKIQAKAVEDIAADPPEEFIFVDDGVITAGESLVVYPIQKDYLVVPDGKQPLIRFEFTLYKIDGSVDNRVQSDLYVIPAVGEGSEPGWTPPTPPEDYPTWDELDAVLLNYADKRISETWATATTVDIPSITTDQITSMGDAGAIDLIINASSGDLELLSLDHLILAPGLTVTNKAPTTVEGTFNVRSGAANEAIKIWNSSGLTQYWSLASDNGFPALNVPTASTHGSVYFLRNPPAALDNVFFGLGATGAHRYRIYGGVADDSHHLQIGDQTARTYQRIFAVSAPLAIGSSVVTDTVTPSNGDIIFTNPVFAEEAVTVSQGSRIYLRNSTDVAGLGMHSLSTATHIYGQDATTAIDLHSFSVSGANALCRELRIFGGANNVLPDGEGTQIFHQSRSTNGVSNPSLTLGDLTARDYYRLRSSGTPLVIGSNLPVNPGAAALGDVIFSNPVFFEQGISGDIGDVTVGDITGSTDPWKLTPSGTDIILGAASTENKVNIPYTTSANNYITIGGSAGWANIGLHPDSTGTRLYFFREPTQTLNSVFANYSAGPGLTTGIYWRFYQARADGSNASSKYLQLGDSALLDYLRISSTGGPLAIGSNTPADALTPANGDVIFTNPVYFEQAMNVGDITSTGDMTLIPGSGTVNVTGGLTTTSRLTAGSYLDITTSGTIARLTATSPATSMRVQEASVNESLEFIDFFNGIGSSASLGMYIDIWGKSETGGATSSRLRFMDSVGRDYARIQALNYPLAIGSGLPATTTASAGNILLTSSVWAESTINIGADGAGGSWATNGVLELKGTFPQLRIYDPANNTEYHRYYQTGATIYAPTFSASTTNAATSLEVFGSMPGTVLSYKLFPFANWGIDQNTSVTIYQRAKGVNTAFLRIGADSGADVDFIRMYSGNAPLVIGTTDPVTDTATNRQVIFTDTAVFEGAGGLNANLIKGDGVNPLVIDNGGQIVSVDAHALEITDRTAGDRGHLLFADNDNVYFSKDAANPSTEPSNVFFYPHTSPLGGDKGIRGIYWCPNVGESRTGGEGIFYRWHLPKTDGTSSTYLQLGGDAAENFTRITSPAGGNPIVFGPQITANTGVLDAVDDVGFGQDVYVAGDLEIVGSIITSTDPDYRIPFAYTPGIGAAQEVIIQFGSTVVTGGSIVVTLDTPLDGPGIVTGTYEGAGAGNWATIGTTMATGTSFTLYAESGQTVHWVCYGAITP